MVIVKVFGGNGNALFQISMGRFLHDLGYKVSYDLSWYEKSILFQTKRTLDIIDTSLIPMSDFNLKIRDYRVIRMIPFALRCKKCRAVVLFEKDFTDIEDLLNKIEKVNESCNVYLIGYWQNKIFAMKSKKYVESILKKYADINMKNSIDFSAVHFRFGDYLNHKNKKRFGNICTILYYRKALSILDSSVNNKAHRIFIISDDVTKAKKFIKELYIPSYYTIEYSEQNTLEDFWLLRNARYVVIANSTFSWWGAFLNNNASTIVSPYKWSNKSSPFKDLRILNWRMIDSKGRVII